MKQLAVIDPSGNFQSGKGKTGVALIEYDEDKDELVWDSLITYSIEAAKYQARHQYWSDIHARVVNADLIVMESFQIRTNGFLIGTMPETIQLIGMLSYFLDAQGIRYVFQTPSQAKARFKDANLLKDVPGLELRNNRYYLNGKMINDHVRDALRHLLYYKKYKKVEVH